MCAGLLKIDVVEFFFLYKRRVLMPKSSLSSLILAFSLSSSFSLWHCNSHSLSVTLTLALSLWLNSSWCDVSTVPPPRSCSVTLVLALTLALSFLLSFTTLLTLVLILGHERFFFYKWSFLCFVLVVMVSEKLSVIPFILCLFLCLGLGSSINVYCFLLMCVLLTWKCMLMGPFC